MKSEVKKKVKRKMKREPRTTDYELGGLEKNFLSSDQIFVPVHFYFLHL